MRTVNEIALEAKVQELEKEIAELKKFELGVGTAFVKIVMGTMTKDDKYTLKGFDELKDIVQKRAEHNVMKMMSNKGEG